MNGVTLHAVTGNGQRIREFELSALLETNAVLTEANDGEGAILALVTTLSPDQSKELANAIKSKLESGLDSAKTFVVGEFMSDADDQTQDVYFNDLVEELRELAEFLNLAAEANQDVKPEFSF